MKKYTYKELLVSKFYSEKKRSELCDLFLRICEENQDNFSFAYQCGYNDDNDSKESGFKIAKFNGSMYSLSLHLEWNKASYSMKIVADHPENKTLGLISNDCFMMASSFLFDSGELLKIFTSLMAGEIILETKAAIIMQKFLNWHNDKNYVFHKKDDGTISFGSESLTEKNYIFNLEYSQMKILFYSDGEICLENKNDHSGQEEKKIFTEQLKKMSRIVSKDQPYMPEDYDYQKTLENF